MRKFLRIFFWSVLSIVVFLGAAMALLIYKVTYGFPVTYETAIPPISFPADRTSVLLFSKSTGFRHAESIDQGKKVFEDLAKKNNWFLYSTEEGGVFNPDQLSKFDVVVFNNCTGRLLSEEQEKALRQYIENGGSWIGIHGAGDNSHHWEWYDQNLVGAKFSHHPLKKHLQEAVVTSDTVADSSLSSGLPATWNQTDEWYVFFDSPRKNGFSEIYSIDGEKIDPDGNFLWSKTKNFGMGKDHPVAWYRPNGKGIVLYTSIGHDARAWAQPAFVQLLENAVHRAHGK